MSFRRGLANLLVIVVSSLIMAQSSSRVSAADGKSKPDRKALEKEFAKKLTGATLAGKFSIDGMPESAKGHTDRYEIEKAEKTNGDHWVITARVKYGKNDLKIPIPLEVRWAGDTPVMTLDDLTIPALGTFTSRILFYGDRYSGTWQHGAAGGHMWGKIEKTKPTGSTQP